MSKTTSATCTLFVVNQRHTNDDDDYDDISTTREIEHPILSGSEWLELSFSGHGMMAESDNALLQRCGGGSRHSVCCVCICHASLKRSVAAAHFLCLSVGSEWVLGFYTEIPGYERRTCCSANMNIFPLDSHIYLFTCHEYGITKTRVSSYEAIGRMIPVIR